VFICSSIIVLLGVLGVLGGSFVVLVFLGALAANYCYYLSAAGIFGR
jgi:hypothetical protein